MKKTILIINADCNDLTSVNHISEELLSMYKLLMPNYELSIFNFTEDSTSLNGNGMEVLKKSPPDYVSFIHPIALRNDFILLIFQALKLEKTAFIFHLYGDFLRQAALLLRAGESIQGKKCIFFSPSDGYAHILKKCFLNTSQVEVLPFSVSSGELTKKKKEVKEVNLIYSGRLSREKNIPALATILDYLKEHQIKARLTIAGAHDDFESSTIGNGPYLGESYFITQELMQRPDVEFIGFKDHQELFKIYSEMDFFISLSTYHDDDFGRAPAEALTHGLPCILTDWIGYRDLGKNFRDDVFLLPVSSSGEQLSINFDNLALWITNYKDFKSDKNIYSKEIIAKELTDKIEKNMKPFGGFTNLMFKLSAEKALYFYGKDGVFNFEKYKTIYLGRNEDE